MDHQSVTRFFSARTIGLSFILLNLFFTAFSCSSQPDVSQSFVRFYDEQSLIPQTLKDSLLQSLQEQSKSPIEHFVIVAASKVDTRKLSIEADEAAAQINKEQFWLWRIFKPKNSRAVTLFYSESPALLQIRYGRSLRLKAKTAGIISGPGYSRLQQLKSSGGRYELKVIAQKIQKAMSDVHVPFYKSFLYLIVTMLDDELFPLLTIPQFELWDGMSSIAALPIYNALNHISPNYVVFTIVLIGCAVGIFTLLMPIFAKFGTKTETPEGGIHYQAKSGVGCLVYLGCFLILLMVVFPMFGFLTITVNSRAEDLLMSQAIGIERTFSVPQQVGWGWIILLLLVTWAAKFVPLMLTTQVDELDLVKSVLKSLLITPVAFFLLPAWVVIFYTCLVVCIAISAFVARLRW